MAIKERKQITGTAAQIGAYAGHNGVLAYATDTKHLHVLSGTAGTTTELANRTDIPDASTLIPREGNRGEVRGYETTGPYTENLSWTSLEAAYSIGGDIKVLDGEKNTAWTKVVHMSMGSVTLGSKWVWAGGSAPTLKFPGILVCHWNHTGGIANYITGAS